MTADKTTRFRRQALSAAVLLVIVGIAIGCASSLLVAKYAIQYFLKHVPKPGLEFALIVMEKDYDLNERQLGMIREAASTIIEEIRVESIARDHLLDRRIVDFVRRFSGELTPEQRTSFERDALAFLRTKRPALIGRIFVETNADFNQLVAIDEIFARHYVQATTESRSLLDVPRTIVVRSAGEVRSVLRPEQIPAFERIIAEMK